MSSVVWLQMRAGLGFRCWNLWVCSLARYQSFWFLGLFNTWIPLPVSWAYGLLLRWRGTASNMLKVGNPAHPDICLHWSTAATKCTPLLCRDLLPLLLGQCLSCAPLCCSVILK